MTNIARNLILTLVASTAALASAQQLPPKPMPMPGQPPITMNAPAHQVTVTYFDKDPRGSSRALGTARVQIPAGEHHKELRQLLRQGAPRGAAYARIREHGRTLIIRLREGHSAGKNHIIDHQAPGASDNN